MGIEQKLIQQSMNTSGSRQARTTNTYGGTSAGGGNRPGTAVKSTITSSGGGGSSATMRKPFQQQTMNDDRMFFERPATIGQGQYHPRIGKQTIAPISSLGQQRHITTSSGTEHHQQQSSQRRPLSWFQYVFFRIKDLYQRFSL
jgi:hypothetical protein